MRNNLNTNKILFFFLVTVVIIARGSICLCAQELQFDIRYYPFSHYGSYMSVMIEKDNQTGKDDLYIRDVSGERMWGWKGVFRIEAMKEEHILPYTVSATPSKLTLITAEGNMELCFEDPDIIRVRGTGIGVKLTQVIGTWVGATYPINVQKTLWHCKMWGPHYAVAVKRGPSMGDVAKGFPNDPVTGRPLFILNVNPDQDGVFEIAIHQFQDAWDGKAYEKPFDACVKDAERHFIHFQAKIPSTPKEYEDMRQLGAYIKWSSVVNPRTAIKRTCMYQSKNYMTAIWSWDNCFGAMSVCNDHAFALDQLLVLFDHQTELGILPDFLTEKYPMYAAFKPPVQGLTMQKLDQLSEFGFSVSELETVYGPIAKLTDFWLNYMDNDQNGIPQYNNSNDCCDNSAIFLTGYPTEAPDLSTHLIIQMDWLSETARMLNRKDEAGKWKERSDRLLTLMIDSLWTGDRFVARNSFTGEYCKDCNSFISYIPIMLGDKLPLPIRKKMLNDLKSSGIVTPYGPASEHPSSPYYIEDGYWRGPVWAPHYLFLVEGMQRCGEYQWAKELAINYCEMCRKHGFPENFSSLSGEPLRDMGYSWTVDVFFALAHEYLEK